ncbi:MAG: glycoside hydrolase family 78 protein [Kiritimatiellaeota bacterium]|nr:glycoside hydrolase family 78 protein [Kiritimatiellota bacterium]
MMKPIRLTCDYGVNPLGIDNVRPRLSWQSAEAGAWKQGAYRVACASSQEALGTAPDLWDSGKVETDGSVNIVYGGKALKSRQRVYWAVKVWDANGAESDWSEAATFEMGLLKETDWAAKWIGISDGSPGCGTFANPLLRRSFKVSSLPQRARMYVSGLGYAKVTVNGKAVSDAVLDPVVTRYDRRALYVTHDITALLTEGENVIGVSLGNGWYNAPDIKDPWWFGYAAWCHHPKALCQIEMTDARGNCRRIVSDMAWKVAKGPSVSNHLRTGETYDAREEKPGWNLPGYNAKKWSDAMVVQSPGGVLNAQVTPIKVMETITPLSVTEVKPGVFVVDMGRNIAGWAQLRVQGAAGTEVTMRYAEKLLEDGDIDQANINTYGHTCQTDKYILRGTQNAEHRTQNEGEVWEASFTYHGFRWVQVTGFPGTPTVDNFRGKVVHSAFESAGEFACSSDLLNWIQTATRASYVGNFVGIPTDCPHREKNGWTGDAALAAETGLFNYATAPAYQKWVRDFLDAQRPSGQLPGVVPSGGFGYNWGSGPAWDAAFWTVPWMLYLYCGETRILEECYAGFKRHLDYMGSLAVDGIISFGLGDWCPPCGDPNSHKAPASLTNTGYYFAEAMTVAKIATLLGKQADAKKFAALAQKIRVAFNKTFYDAKTGQYAGNGQTSMGCALYQGIATKTETPKVLDALIAAVAAANNHLDYGILGAKYVPAVLAAFGHAELAYAITTQKDFPSYNHWREQGATTLWESWEGNASRNHIMFGDVSAWMFKTLAGINPDDAKPAFGRVRLAPTFIKDLTWVSATHETMYGTVAVSWKRTAEATVTLDITLPANTDALLNRPPTIDRLESTTIT